MQFSENEMAVLKYNEDAVCALIAFHSVQREDSGLSENSRARHEERVHELRRWRTQLVKAKARSTL